MLKKKAIAPPESKLTAFFKLCQADHFTKTLFYVEIPKYYTWDNSAKKFSMRKQGIPVSGHLNIFRADTMGRMRTIHPSNIECFFLRILLHNVRGPTSFEDIRIIDGVTCESYREAC